MVLAPGAAMVNASGCFLDWLITRAWSRVMLLAIPGLLALTLVVMSLWGTMLNRTQLAAWYLELGERELKKIDDNWAFGGSTGKKVSTELDSIEEESNPSGKSKSGSKKSGESRSAINKSRQDSESAGTEPAKDTKIPRFAEAVFRKAQQLDSENEDIMFVIAATMSQRGSTAQANNLLRRIAPDEKEGHLRSHALIAYNMLRQPLSSENLPALKHHLNQASKLAGTPAQLLAYAAEFAYQDKNFIRAIELLKRATEQQPEYFILTLKAAQDSKNDTEAESAVRRAKAYYTGLITKGEEKPRDRLILALVLISYNNSTNDELVQAAKLLEERLDRPDLKDDERKELRRGLSEVYRMRFRKIIARKNESDVAAMTDAESIGLLDKALQIDPTNPGVPEEVAKLTRFGIKPSDELVSSLEKSLSLGIATPLTHAMLSELHIIRDEVDKAIEHLRIVTTRAPMVAQYQNNLAYALAKTKPDELKSALEHAWIAANLETETADFRDTLGFVYLKMNKITDAITQFEYAISLARQNNKRKSEFHRNIAEAYKLAKNEEQSAVHLKIADQIDMEAKENVRKSEPSATKAKSDGGEKNKVLPNVEKTDLPKN